MGTNLLESVAEIFRRKEAAAAANFEALVRAFDNEAHPPKPAWIAEQLEALGKSIEDLHAAVEYRRRRLNMAAKLEKGPALRMELGEVQAAYQAEMGTWAEQQAAHDRIVRPLIARAVELEAAIAEAEGMRGKLRGTYALLLPTFI